MFAAAIPTLEWRDHACESKSHVSCCALPLKVQGFQAPQSYDRNMHMMDQTCSTDTGSSTTKPTRLAMFFCLGFQGWPDVRKWGVQLRKPCRSSTCLLGKTRPRRQRPGQHLPPTPPAAQPCFLICSHVLRAWCGRREVKVQHAQRNASHIFWPAAGG